MYKIGAAALGELRKVASLYLPIDDATLGPGNRMTSWRVFRGSNFRTPGKSADDVSENEVEASLVVNRTVPPLVD